MSGTSIIAQFSMPLSQVTSDSGKFRHTFANSENPDETGCLIRIFTVCLDNLIFIPIIQK